MALSLTTDHTRAFDEAYEVSGALVTIGGTENIKAILPLDLQTGHEIDGDGATQFETETAITVLTTALPAITRATVVDISGTEYRITQRTTEGTVCTRLDLISP
jgi:hypothetical protein